MKLLIKVFAGFVMMSVLFASCTKDSEIVPVNDGLFANEGLLASDAAFSLNVLLSGKAASQANPRGKKSLAIWADCEGFATIGTTAQFKPTAGNFDELYTGVVFQSGLGAISESKPGDQDYNGGRWHVNVLKEGVEENKYLNACSVEDLDLNDFESTSTYFECPLRPVN